tara:strand:+ start:552 stop:770 length:219 start_codon:yes stop_codon:yes gene_type:complete
LSSRYSSRVDGLNCKIKMKKKIILFVFALFISSCEDDPLLEPTTETEDKGSYAKLSLPSSKKDLNKKNPEIY